MLDLNGRIAVLGLGRSGRAVVDWALARAGHGPADVTVFVEHESDELRAASMPYAEQGVHVELGASAVPEGFALIVSSPGIAPHRPLLASALASGVPVVSELELAFHVCRAPIVAVTGTNGKTTTTALVAHLLLSDGRNAVAAGNIGTPALEVARGLEPTDVLVAECSSFQLALTREFHPRISVLLNITPDHLDWHGSLERYALDKARVFANQGAGDVIVLEIDDPGSAALRDAAAATGAGLMTVSVRGIADAFLDGDTLTLEQDGRSVPLARIDELGIAGVHNVSNALAASAAALACGVSESAVRAGLRTFAPIEHRLEPVGTVGGVRFVNDSKATNPDAVLKALTAFDGSDVIVLLGGRNKGNDFTQLAAACSSRCRLAVLFGESRGELEEAFRHTSGAYVVADGMREAVAEAVRCAMPGDVVVFSPACASFDEFDNFEQRGRAFGEVVRGLEGVDR